MVDPGGGEERRLGKRPQRRDAAGEQKLAQRLGLRRAAGLARRHGLDAAGAQMRGEALELRRFADALAAFESDEPASFGARHFFADSFSWILPAAYS